jgi:hypothetical protein
VKIGIVFFVWHYYFHNNEDNYSTKIPRLAFIPAFVTICMLGFYSQGEWKWVAACSGFLVLSVALYFLYRKTVEVKVPLQSTLSKDVDVRWEVAANPSTTADTLTTLSKDGDVNVRLGVAKNPSTPADALTTLSKDGNVDVRCGVAANPSTPADTLTALSKDINSALAAATISPLAETNDDDDDAMGA